MIRSALISTLVVVLICLAAPSRAAEDNMMVIKDLRLLVVVYRGEADAEPKQRIDNEELGSIRGAIQTGRLFYFRNSFGKLNLTVSYELIDAVAPENGGPTYDNIVADLRTRGFVNNQFDGIYTTGIGLRGNWGGFMVFDKTGAAFSGGGPGGQLSWFPSADKSIGFDWGWGFVHEFQHALDLAIAGGAGFHEFVHGHPYADSVEEPDRVIENPGSQHWDWEACTLRNFKHYIEIPGATSSYIYAIDSDGDGLADRHPSLVLDEERFGTDPNNPDTDGDGLTDLEELAADIYFGSNPRDTDSDGDGLIDGSDLWPTVAISPAVGYAFPQPKIDGKIDGVYSPLVTRWYATNWEDLPKDGVQTFACWDEENLYLAVKAPKTFDMSVQIDTSAHNGFWEGGDTYLWSVKSNGEPSVGIPKHAVWPGSKTVWSTDDEGNTVVEMMLPSIIGQGWSREANFGGPRLPEDVADGLVLLDGRAVSFNLIFDFPENKKRVLLTPNWSMFSTRLEKDSRDPDLPILRYSEPMQNTERPVVRVDGVSGRSRVTVVNEKGDVLGRGRGNGAIELAGVKVGSDEKSGLNMITAKTSEDKESRPFALVVDASAKPPVISKGKKDEGKASVNVTGEAGAAVTLEYEMSKGEWTPLAVAALDEKGEGTIEVDTSMNGFYGEYFDTDEWTEPAMYRIDPEIQFNYKGGSPAGKLIAPESFSIRWTGYLDVDKDTKATFFLTTDDGSRLLVDGEMVIDNWGHHGDIEKSAEVTLSKGQHEIQVIYFEEFGWAAAYLEWQPEGGERTFAIPVKAFKSASGKMKLRAVQEDVIGNQSGPSGTLTID